MSLNMQITPRPQSIQPPLAPSPAPSPKTEIKRNNSAQDIIDMLNKKHPCNTLSRLKYQD